jgi:protein-L-isoaspartate O-methyltransferase
MSFNFAVSAAAFEAKYRQSSDPWQFGASPYEQRRYATILSSLMRARYSRAFEPGCSVGILTAALARRCDEVLACDIAPTAVHLARRRCATLPHVRVEQADLAHSMPQGLFDLIVFGELGYYFTGAMLTRITRTLAKRLTPSGEFVAIHWRGQSKDHVLPGDTVHAILKEALEQSCVWIKGECFPEFRLDVWRRA